MKHYFQSFFRCMKIFEGAYTIVRAEKGDELSGDFGENESD